MIIDNELYFSNDQVVTAAAASTKVLDQVKAGGPFKPGMYLVVQTGDTALDPTTSMTFSLQTSDDNFSADTTVLYTETIPVASLLANTRLIHIPVPWQLKRYVRMYYTPVGGDATEGKIKAFFVKDPEVQEPVA